MKKIIKVILWLFGIVIVCIAALLSYVKFALPNVGPAPDLKIEYTQERLERGKYLAHNVTMCITCHSSRNFSKFAGPIEDGTWGQGGELFGRNGGLPGNYYSRNITPYGVGNWTDGELYRAITSGVSKDGHALFPIMPHDKFGKLDTEDVYSIITYIRSLEPIKKDVELSSADFPMNFIINTIPQTPQPQSRPAKDDMVNYGKYMFTAALCDNCHTQKDKGKPVEGMYLAGGFKFPFPDGSCARSANITSDKETGIGNWTEEQFLARFAIYRDSLYVPHDVKPGDFQTPMPWLFFSQMDEYDLKAIFAYLQTVPPVKNSVIKFENASGAPIEKTSN